MQQTAYAAFSNSDGTQLGIHRVQTLGKRPTSRRKGTSIQPFGYAPPAQQFAWPKRGGQGAIPGHRQYQDIGNTRTLAIPKRRCGQIFVLWALRWHSLSLRSIERCGGGFDAPPAQQFGSPRRRPMYYIRTLAIPGQSQAGWEFARAFGPYKHARIRGIPNRLVGCSPSPRAPEPGTFGMDQKKPPSMT